MLVQKISAVPPAVHAMGLIWFDRDGQVVDLNLNAALMLDASPHWVLMQNFFSLCGQAQPCASLAAEWADIRQGRVSGAEHAMLGETGVSVWTALSFSHRYGRTNAEQRILALAVNLDTLI
jgi:PAS domain-containing protein